MSDTVKIEVAGSSFHLGYSRLHNAMTCMRQYKYAYIDKIRTAGSPVMRRGTALHNVFEDMFRYKSGYQKLMPIDKAHDRVEVRGAEQKLPPSMIKELHSAMEIYYEKMYGVLEPALMLDGETADPIEGEFSFVRGGVKVTGRIDLATENSEGFIIHDYKFSNNPWKEDRITHSVQPIIYQWAAIDIFEKAFGIPYLGFQYDVINVWPEQVIQTIWIPRMEESKSKWWEQLLADWGEVIQAGVFPANPSTENCKWCDYRGKHCKPALFSPEITMLKSCDLAEGEW